MKRHTVVAYAAIALLLAAGCSAGDTDNADYGHDAPAGDEPAAADDGPAGDEARAGHQGSAAPGGVIAQVEMERLEQAIVHTVRLDIVTGDVAAAAQDAGAIARAAGGFVADEVTTDRRSSLTLRIPATEHADAVGDLEALGTVTDRGRSAEDVTSQVVDTESRIASQRQSIARIRTLLDEASDLTDVIAIEAELARRESDLDALLSRQERLADLTTLATVTLTITTDEGESEPESAIGFAGGLRNGWSAFTEVLVVSAAVFGALLPFLVFAAMIGVPLWVWLRRRRPQAAAQAPVPPPAV